MMTIFSIKSSSTKWRRKTSADKNSESKESSMTTSNWGQEPRRHQKLKNTESTEFMEASSDNTRIHNKDLLVLQNWCKSISSVSKKPKCWEHRSLKINKSSLKKSGKDKGTSNTFSSKCWPKRGKIWTTRLSMPGSSETMNSRPSNKRRKMIFWPLKT